MLTGESAPVTKSDLPSYEVQSDIFDPEHYKLHTSHMLSGGTTVIQLKTEKVIAMVKSTGFQSTKGQMVKSMMLINQAAFSFYIDAIKFLAVMLLIGLICVGITVKPMMDQNFAPADMWLRLLDIITIAVPPALPAALSSSVLFSLSRLKKKQIFCRAPPKVLVAGRVNTMVFDKTGTLTEESIEGFIMRRSPEMKRGFTGREQENVWDDFVSQARTDGPPEEFKNADRKKVNPSEKNPQKG